MIEVVNLKKVYKTKGGNSVKALNGVSLQFPDKGMVFLLGKSGSGKSTLLNVCGGLDSPTEGEIIIKGRSSKNFTQNDFDSYRNTLVGFVFQEYNILNEFSVENNIVLALELQGKSKDKQSIEKLLKEVDLEGYGHRKPNTLSGGQKQRIAIARALIKNPEIIMADEPTGALDSNTGKQVLDTLKKLSKDKLVIVVSHDREFAEQYADRIIELKDGKVLTDVSKIEQKQEKLNDNVSVVGDSVLCVNDGENLQDEDFKFIKAFLKKNKNAIICSNEHDVQNVKKVTKINSNGYKEVFKETDETDIQIKKYTKSESKFITSRLPMKHAFTIGASGLKSKPIRLIMTVILCTFAFVLFGLLSTMMLYDGDKVFTESMMSSDYERIKLQKQYTYNEKYYEGKVLVNDYKTEENTKLTEKELEEYKQIFGKNTFGTIELNYMVDNVATRVAEHSYYKPTILNVAVVDKTNELYNMMIGKYPTKSNEIAISSYLAESLVNVGLNKANTEKKYNIKDINDIIGKVIVLNNKQFKVSGIFQTPSLPEKYEKIKEMTTYDWSLLNNFSQELANGTYQLALVSKEGLKKVSVSQDTIWRLMYNVGNIYVGNENYSGFINYIKYSSNSEMFDITYIDKNNTDLQDNEIIVSSSALYSIIESNYRKLSSSYRYKWEFNIREKAWRTLTNYSSGLEPLSEAKYNSYKNDVLKFVKETGVLDIAIKSYNQYDNKPIDGFSKKVKVIGYFDLDNGDFALVTDSLYKELEQVAIKFNQERGNSFTVKETNYVVPAGAKYDSIYLSYDRSEEQTNALLPYIKNIKDEDGTTKYLSNPLASQVIMVNETVEELSQLFLWAGIVMAVFAILLLSNFIATSISAKTREIGILRAVGARSVDVFKIFFSESFIIAAICVVLSIIGGFVACGFLNDIAGDLIHVSLFVFGILSILILIVVALLTTILATFIPVRNAARKKPVDSIRAI